MPGYYAARPCEQLEAILGSQNRTLTLYPDCEPFFSGVDPNKNVAVKASIWGKEAGYAGSHAASGMTFGAATWLALAIHAIGVEFYVGLPLR